MKSLQLLTPAKINAPLKILFKRNDGLHELYMHTIPIALFDSLVIRQHDSLQFECTPNIECSQESNLVIKALRAFEQATNQKVSVHIKLEKQIPTQAGLGGGSGNAAGMLRALNRWYGYPLKHHDLWKLASQLGADVPFFLSGLPCRVSGFGEQLEPLHQIPEFPLIVIKPPVAISTAQAYQNCLPNPDVSHFPSPSNLKNFQKCLVNDFEKTLILQFPVLQKIYDALKQVNAIGTLLSGSGSAVFGVFESYQQRNHAVKKLTQQKLGKIFPTHTLNSHNYWQAKTHHGHRILSSCVSF